MLKKICGRASKGDWVFSFVVWCAALSYGLNQQPPEHLSGNSLAITVIVLAAFGALLNVVFVGYVRIRRDEEGL